MKRLIWFNVKIIAVTMQICMSNCFHHEGAATVGWCWWPVACVCQGRAAGVQANWTRLIMQNLTLLTAADVTRRTLNSIGIWNCLLSLFAVGCMTSNSTIKVWQCFITSLDIKPISWDIITNNEWWRWRGDLQILTENLINSSYLSLTKV